MDTMQITTKPALLSAIERAKTKKLTEEQIRLQRVSFIYGSVGSKSGLTRERIEIVLDEQYGKVIA